MHTHDETAMTTDAKPFMGFYVLACFACQYIEMHEAFHFKTTRGTRTMINMPTNFVTARDYFNRTSPKTTTNEDGDKHAKLSSNTKLVMPESYDAVDVILHETRIVTFLSDGWSILRHGGYKTNTTKRRMNQCGFNVFQKNHEWFISTNEGTFAWGDEDKIFIDDKGMVHWESGLALCIASN